MAVAVVVVTGRATRVPPSSTAVGGLAVLRATAQMQGVAIAAVDVVHTAAEARLATPTVVLGTSLWTVSKAASVTTAAEL